MRLRHGNADWRPSNPDKRSRWLPTRLGNRVVDTTRNCGFCSNRPESRDPIALQHGNQHFEGHAYDGFSTLAWADGENNWASISATWPLFVCMCMCVHKLFWWECKWVRGECGSGDNSPSETHLQVHTSRPRTTEAFLPME
ncbi:unnamed protein product [Protopolystoma xenopodis]|uniref:Uncharacterized protein n=1 Tax=Protopolystoma xenopodis TaxID=117903 RepID=A0A3S5BPK1_9PLAT|nr:unnamed protein product [Protopolystoma xenopodis]